VETKQMPAGGQRYIGQEPSVNPITGATVTGDCGEYCDQASSVREYSYQENKNRRFRP